MKMNKFWQTNLSFDVHNVKRNGALKEVLPAAWNMKNHSNVSKKCPQHCRKLTIKKGNNPCSKIG
jgi:hypothetical protein